MTNVPNNKDQQQKNSSRATVIGGGILILTISGLLVAAAQLIHLLYFVFSISITPMWIIVMVVFGAAHNIMLELKLLVLQDEFKSFKEKMKNK